jgi:hypothetical protein
LKRQINVDKRRPRRFKKRGEVCFDKIFLYLFFVYFCEKNLIYKVYGSEGENLRNHNLGYIVFSIHRLVFDR